MKLKNKIMGQKRHENKKTDGPNKQKPVGVGE